MWGCGAGIRRRRSSLAVATPDIRRRINAVAAAGAPATRSVLLCSAGTRFLVDLAPSNVRRSTVRRGRLFARRELELEPVKISICGMWRRARMGTGIRNYFHFNWDSLQHPRLEQIFVHRRSKWKHGRKVFQGTRGKRSVHVYNDIGCDTRVQLQAEAAVAPVTEFIPGGHEFLRRRRCWPHHKRVLALVLSLGVHDLNLDI